MEKQKLFVGDGNSGWMCMNCGHIHTGAEAPELCPVCQHEQGFFLRLEEAPYSISGLFS